VEPELSEGDQLTTQVRLSVQWTLTMIKQIAVTSGFEAVQGKRWHYEDTHVCVDHVEPRFFNDVEILKKHCVSFYALFDGHGGNEASHIAMKNILHNVVESEPFGQGSFEEALRVGILKTEEQILQASSSEGWMSGTTAVVLLVVDLFLYCANVGDSECVVGNKTPFVTGFSPKCVTKIHRPTRENPEEVKRIQDLGGMVQQGRVFGSLSVSRALGDCEYKTPRSPHDFVTAEPYVVSMPLVDETYRVEFAICACDGVWDVVTYKGAVKLVGKHFRKKDSPFVSCDTLVKEALCRGSGDNISCIIVFFRYTYS